MRRSPEPARAEAALAERERKAVPLHTRPDLSIPEVMRMMRLGRKTVEQRIADGRYRSYRQGARLRVVTASIFADIDAQAKRSKAA